MERQRKPWQFTYVFNNGKSKNPSDQSDQKYESRQRKGTSTIKIIFWHLCLGWIAIAWLMSLSWSLLPLCIVEKKLAFEMNTMFIYIYLYITFTTSLSLIRLTGDIMLHHQVSISWMHCSSYSLNNQDNPPPYITITWVSWCPEIKFFTLEFVTLKYLFCTETQQSSNLYFFELTMISEVRVQCCNFLF